MSSGPEPCFSSFATGRCYSPIACGAFGYCRNRNLLHGMPSDEAAAAWRVEAAERKSIASRHENPVQDRT